jgi:hypothetical protein
VESADFGNLPNFVKAHHSILPLVGGKMSSAGCSPYYAHTSHRYGHTPSLLPIQRADIHPISEARSCRNSYDGSMSDFAESGGADVPYSVERSRTVESGGRMKADCSLVFASPCSSSIAKLAVFCWPRNPAVSPRGHGLPYRLYRYRFEGSNAQAAEEVCDLAAMKRTEIVVVAVAVAVVGCERKSG